MKRTLAFDIYGTLFDVQGIEDVLNLYSDQAHQVAHTWRDKQLEYSFRRGLMERFKDFSICTRDALRYCNAFYKLGLSEDDETRLLDAYDSLPPFADVLPALTALGRDFHIYAFSNGCQNAVQSLLENAGIGDAFNGVVSVSETKTFKPDPKVYTHFLRVTKSDPEHTWLVSTNSFDIIGADSVGMRTAWVKRESSMVFDPWGAQPEVVVQSLTDLPVAVKF